MPARHRARPAARAASSSGRSAVAVVALGAALTVATAAVVAADASVTAAPADRRAVALAVATPATPPAAAAPATAPPTATVTVAEPPAQPVATASVPTPSLEGPVHLRPTPTAPTPTAPEPSSTPTTTTATAPDGAGSTDADETSRRILSLLEEIRVLLGAGESIEGSADDGTEQEPAAPTPDQPGGGGDDAPAAEAPAPEPPARNGQPFAGGRPYVDPGSDAAVAAASATDPAQRAALQHLADEGSATWVGGWSGDPASAVAGVVDAALAASQTPTFVLYDIPGRDCGSYSAGGAADAGAYRQWVEGVAQGLDGAGAVVILEPDALAGMDCLPADAQEERLGLLAEAAARLDAAGATVYVDAGSPSWQPVDVMAERLEAVGVDRVRGFALNVSNYQGVADNVAYGDALVAALGGGAKYVIDTSRNGNGPTGEGGEGAWCNPAGRSVGEPFTTEVGGDVDALLWVKVPGDSDGTCGGGPAAGQWWPERALELAAGRGGAAPRGQAPQEP
jgi:endoglucanase